MLIVPETRPWNGWWLVTCSMARCANEFSFKGEREDAAIRLRERGWEVTPDTAELTKCPTCVQSTRAAESANPATSPQASDSKSDGLYGHNWLGHRWI